MGRGRGKRSRARRYGAMPSHHESAGAGSSSAPDLGIDVPQLNMRGPRVQPELHVMQEQAAPAPEPQPEQELDRRELEPTSSTFSPLNVQQPQIVPMVIGDKEFKIAMSRVEVEPEQHIWAVKLVNDGPDNECQCRFHQQLRMLTDLRRDNAN